MIKVTTSKKVFCSSDGSTIKLKTVEKEYSFKNLKEACEYLDISIQLVQRAKKKRGLIFPFNYKEYRFNSFNDSPIIMPSKRVSKYNGVQWIKRTNSWRVIIYVDSKQIYVGSSKCERKAGIKYNEAVYKYGLIGIKELNNIEDLKND